MDPIASSTMSLSVNVDDLLALAKRVVEQQKARKDEDVQAWAERLAREVGNATD